MLASDLLSICWRGQLPGRRGQQPNAPCHWLPRVLAVLTCCFAAALFAAPSAAQAPEGSLLVRVVDSTGREPIAGAEVRVNGTVAGITDGAGTLRVSRLSGPIVRVQVQRVGFQAAEIAPTAAALVDGVVLVTMKQDPLSLPNLHVQGRAGVRTQALKDFYRRAETGAGRYFTRADIDRLRPRSVNDLFRSLPNMRMTPSSTGFDEKPQFAGDAPSLFSDIKGKKGECPILYYLDGVPFEPTHDGAIGIDVRPQELEGIEVYRSRSAAPAKYARGVSVCGVILLWKRERI